MKRQKSSIYHSIKGTFTWHIYFTCTCSLTVKFVPSTKCYCNIWFDDERVPIHRLMHHTYNEYLINMAEHEKKKMNKGKGRGGQNEI